MTRPPWSLPSVALAGRANLPDASGIYFVRVNGSIEYIGKAGSFQSRWGNNGGHGPHHHLAELLKLDRYSEVSIAYWRRPRWRMGHDEAVAIRFYEPPMNGRMESPVWWIAALDNVTGSLKVAAVLLMAYAAWQVSRPNVAVFRSAETVFRNVTSLPFSLKAGYNGLRKQQ